MTFSSNKVDDIGKLQTNKMNTFLVITQNKFHCDKLKNKFRTALRWSRKVEE